MKYLYFRYYTFRFKDLRNNNFIRQGLNGSMLSGLAHAFGPRKTFRSRRKINYLRHFSGYLNFLIFPTQKGFPWTVALIYSVMWFCYLLISFNHSKTIFLRATGLILYNFVTVFQVQHIAGAPDTKIMRYKMAFFVITPSQMIRYTTVQKFPMKFSFSKSEKSTSTKAGQGYTRKAQKGSIRAFSLNTKALARTR